MIQDLIKLADFLDQHQKKQMADAVDQMVENLAMDPMNAPKAWNARDPADISGEWDLTEEYQDEVDTEIMEPGEMEAQHKAPKEIVRAIQNYLARQSQHPISIQWHIPGQGPGINTDEEQGEPPYWIVVARSDDPTDLPDDNYWGMWEVTQDDPYWTSGVDIEGKPDRRMYGEW